MISDDDIKKKVMAVAQAKQSAASPSESVLKKGEGDAEKASAANALHPLAKAKADAKSPQSPKVGGGSVSKVIMKKKGYTFTMGKWGLLGMALSLMFLGVFTFGGGFLVGMWFTGYHSAPPSVGYAQAPAHYYGAAPAHSAYGGAPNAYHGALAHEANAIGFGGIASNQAAFAAQQTVDSVNIPGVPAALSPLVMQTQYAIGQQAANAAREHAGRAVNGGIQQGMQPPMGGGYGGGAPVGPQSSASHPAATHPAAAPSTEQKEGFFAHLWHEVDPSSGGQAKPAAHADSSAGASGKGDDKKKQQQYYTVRLGEFVAKENAQHLAGELENYSYPAQIKEEKDPSGMNLYVVDSGRYASQELARQAVERFTSMNMPRALIIPLPEKKEG